MYSRYKKGVVMTLHDIMEILDAEVLVGHDHLNTDVKTAFSADLMSDVLAFAKPRSLLLTGLTNPQVVRTASILDTAAIIIVRGKTPPEETLKLAEELDIPILLTRYILFETSGRLYANGIVGCIKKL
jgi:predicted transcriptional regulator